MCQDELCHYVLGVANVLGVAKQVLKELETFQYLPNVALCPTTLLTV